MLNTNKPTDIAESLVYDHVVTAYNKARVKSEMFTYPKSGYRLSLTDQEAKALHLFTMYFPVPEEDYHYEAVNLQAISTEIREAYSFVAKRKPLVSPQPKSITA